MATFYINPAFGAGGDGSEATPFDSWADVTWTAGNTYLQKSGTIFLGGVTVGASGTAGNPITLGTYGGAENAIIRNASGAGISAGGRNYVDFNNLTCDGCSSDGFTVRGTYNVFTDCKATNNGGSGFTFSMATAITNRQYIRCEASDNAIRGFGAIGTTGSLVFDQFLFDTCISNNNGTLASTHFGIGVMLDTAAATGSTVKNAEVKNCTVINNAGDGIVFRITVTAYPGVGTEFNGVVNIHDNEVRNNGNSGINVARSVYGVIRDNHVHGNGAGGTLGGIWTGGNVGLKILRNDVHDNFSNSADGAGIFDDQYNSGCVVALNKVYNNLHVDTVSPTYGGYGIAIYRTTSSRHFGNVCFNNHNNMFVGQQTVDALISNVTLVEATGKDFWVWSDQTNSNQITLKNSIVDGTVYADNATVGTQTWEYNCVTGAYTNVTAGTGSITTNPLFDGAYRLGASSPCIGAGVQVPDLLLRDYDGKHIDGDVDIGARQFHASRSISDRTRADR